MTESQAELAKDVALVGIMAAASNILGFFSIPGPLNIQFGLTAIPFLIVAFTLGGAWGALCGLLGGMIQAQKYGHILYVFYTAIQGGVAGYFALRPRQTRASAPIFALIAGFFFFWWIDILTSSKFAFRQLGETSFANAPKVFGRSISLPFPIWGSVAGTVLFTAVTFIVLRPGRALQKGSPVHLAIAGCCGATAYVPWDAFVLYGVQGYPWLPTWFVLSKDLMQDFIAAWAVAILFSSPRIRNMLAEYEAEGANESSRSQQPEPYGHKCVPTK